MNPPLIYLVFDQSNNRCQGRLILVAVLMVALTGTAERSESGDWGQNRAKGKRTLGFKVAPLLEAR